MVNQRDDHRSLIAAAEQAAAADNYLAAEELLREAALAQEARLGALHPDLANTLNNLGVVCEINNHPDDAERCFRRAVSIATLVLKADHPFVVTSRQNLRDFCHARGKSVELLALPAPAPGNVETRAVVAVSPRVSALRRQSKGAQRIAPRQPFRPLLVKALGPGVMMGTILAVALPSLGSNERAESAAIAILSAHETRIPSQPNGPIDATVVPHATTEASASRPDAVSTSGITAATATPTMPTVLKSRLCATLEDWLCEPADRPVPTGQLFFFTQVKSTSATTIQHRWYRDNRLMRSVDLPVLASPDVGYRSFSRYIMDSESAGNWRVELRTEDGVLLHEERFSVR